ncbi:MULTISPECIES: hypothetical protein [unclassified Saccharopolyspora]|uniref:hypothetical protein n=1 Tax=unclassified Saccharopolyspora TaxID=2646250 RepID=UPI001CD64F63|nr:MULTISPECIES: hypothetical protein [unclassified Saccharopolyspora]MCA1190007.1 hypothetical protein [Saccharopolyspora sp. 6T]MCA1279722.1 hypothetical protein [Saccharopolyspora sp. 7B]
MGLDTKVEGDPDSLTATCDWLRDQAATSSATSDQVHSVRNDSEAGWGEAAGEVFRNLMTQFGRMTDDVSTALTDTCGALETHSDDLRTVRAKMQQARDVAAAGGLEIKGYEIQEPGLAPANPTPLPTDKPATPQQKQDHAAAVQAQDAFEKKAQAFAQASQIVKDARKVESDSQHALIRFLSGALDPAKLSLALADMSTGMAGAVAVRTTQFREFAEAAITKAERAANLTTSQNLSLANRTQAARIQITNELAAKDAMDNAMASRAARTIDRFPPKVQAVIRGMDAKLVPKVPKAGSPVLRGAGKVASKLPWLGLGITSFGVGLDISNGKDPTQAVVSGGSSFVSGAVVGAAIGGPVGVVVGGLVGIGVGFAVDELWPD